MERNPVTAILASNQSVPFDEASALDASERFQTAMKAVGLEFESVRVFGTGRQRQFVIRVGTRAEHAALAASERENAEIEAKAGGGAPTLPPGGLNFAGVPLSAQEQADVSRLLLKLLSGQK